MLIQLLTAPKTVGMEISDANGLAVSSQSSQLLYNHYANYIVRFTIRQPFPRGPTAVRPGRYPCDFIILGGRSVSLKIGDLDGIATVLPLLCWYGLLMLSLKDCCRAALQTRQLTRIPSLYRR